MLKVTASPMKVTTKPSKAKVLAAPAGHAAMMQRAALADERAREYKAGHQQRMTEHLKRLHLLNAARGEANRALREAEKHKPTRMWDNYEEVAVIQKSARLRFAIAACTRDGFRCVVIRELYFRKRDGQWLPSKNGIMIPIMAPITRTSTPDPNNLPKMVYPMHELLLALTQAADVAEHMELADPDKAVWLYYEDKTEEEQNENR